MTATGTGELWAATPQDAKAYLAAMLGLFSEPLVGEFSDFRMLTEGIEPESLAWMVGELACELLGGARWPEVLDRLRRELAAGAAEVIGS